MALRDHSLDDKITKAAKSEFLDKGFEKASLRNIASKAGITVGAIRTRYKTKDDLFYSLVEPLVDTIKEDFLQAEDDCFDVDLPTEDFLYSMDEGMEAESEMILNLLFEDYDMSVLLLCRSQGSQLENFFSQVVDKKFEETMSFLESIKFSKIDDDVIKMLVNSQFKSYLDILNEGYDYDKAMSLMKAAATYHKGGWINIFEEGV